MLPLGRVALLLYLSEDAVCLIVYAMSASREFAVALDFLPAAHVTSL